MNKALEFRNSILENNLDFNNNIMYGKSNGLIRDFGEDEVNIF